MDDLIGGGLLSQAPQVAVEKVIAIFDFEAQAEGDLGEFNKIYLNLNESYSRNIKFKNFNLSGCEGLSLIIILEH